jgi:cyclopropane fatty-acyl-phospholipid synthase-like methyltransferase
MNFDYREYVGNKNEFDFCSGTQFSLLFNCGLRENHKVLDFGCGCLRLGRLLIPYLDVKNYFGYDPNKNLFSDFIENEFGYEIIKKKQAVIISNFDEIKNKFDFIIAHSIFSHTGVDLTIDYIKFMSEIIEDDGIILATFYKSGNRSNTKNGWKYKECFAYSKKFIKKTAKNFGLTVVELNWWHPRQTWFALYKQYRNVPTEIGRPVLNIDNLVVKKYYKNFPDKYFKD